MKKIITTAIALLSFYNVNDATASEGNEFNPMELIFEVSKTLYEIIRDVNTTEGPETMATNIKPETTAESAVALITLGFIDGEQFTHFPSIRDINNDVTLKYFKDIGIDESLKGLKENTLSPFIAASLGLCQTQLYMLENKITPNYANTVHASIKDVIKNSEYSNYYAGTVLYNFGQIWSSTSVSDRASLECIINASKNELKITTVSLANDIKNIELETPKPEERAKAIYEHFLATEEDEQNGTEFASTLINILNFYRHAEVAIPAPFGANPKDLSLLNSLNTATLGEGLNMALKTLMNLSIDKIHAISSMSMKDAIIEILNLRLGEDNCTTLGDILNTILVKFPNDQLESILTTFGGDAAMAAGLSVILLETENSILQKFDKILEIAGWLGKDGFLDIPVKDFIVSWGGKILSLLNNLFNKKKEGAGYGLLIEEK